MTRRITYWGAFIGSATIAAALTAQVTPPAADAPGPDIIVNGATPKMVAGLWRFRSGTRLTDPAPGRPRVSPQRGREWDRCISDGDTPAIVDQLVGEQARFDVSGYSGMLCSALKLMINRARAVGTRRCSLPGDGGLGLQITTAVRAKITPTSIQADYTMDGDTISGFHRTARWQVNAERIGDCPGVPLAVPTPAATPVATPTPGEPTALAKSPEPTIVRETTAEPSDAGAPVATKPATPVADAQPEDIVVVARRLRRLRLHYGVSDSRVSWCHADISSGDKRVDRIGCAIVRACTKSGTDTVEATLACFRRRVDSLEPDAPPGA